jgi:hypothetical protein
MAKQIAIDVSYRNPFVGTETIRVMLAGDVPLFQLEQVCLSALDLQHDIKDVIVLAVRYDVRAQP